MTTAVKHSAAQPPVLPAGVFTGWLADYARWVEPTTDGALEAIFAGASIELALAVGRDVGIHYGRATYANLYTAVVGTTGVARKTTILSRGQLVRDQAFAPGLVRVARSIGSGEGLLEYFCDEVKDAESQRMILKPIPGQRALLDEPEFTNLLKKARRPGTANITEYLLNLYDGADYSPRTRNRPIKVEKPYFCLSTATTLESLELALEDVDIDSGLVPRFAIFWCSPREPLAFPPEPDQSALRRLATQLEDISLSAAALGRTQGTLSLSPQARNEWETAYHEFTIAARQAPKAAGAIMTRVPTMVMKWSLLYALQAGRGTVEVDDLARGVLLGTYLMDTARLVPGHVRQAPVARIEQKILDSLARVQGKWLTGADIHRLVGGRVKAEELRRSLKALAELGALEEAPSPSGRSSVFRLP